MYVITTNVSINLTTHFIDVIQKAKIKNEVSLTFNELITIIKIMAKILLYDREPTIKMYGKISIVTVVKSKVVVSKK
jgi:hypothetical protein